MLETNRTPWQLTRLLMLLCWLMWILTFFITVTLLQASTQVRVLANVVQIADKGFISFKDDFTQFVPLNAMSPNLIDEMLVRYYLDMRYSLLPDKLEMERRWGEKGVVAYLSTASAYRDFQEPALYLKTVEDMRPRVVDIVSISRQGNYYDVAMDLYEYEGSRGWKKQTKNLWVYFTYVPARAYLGKSFSNPKGFVVTYVSDSPTAKK